jgi:hypothetical protein
VPRNRRRPSLTASIAIRATDMIISTRTEERSSATSRAEPSSSITPACPIDSTTASGSRHAARHSWSSSRRSEYWSQHCPRSPLPLRTARRRTCTRTGFFMSPAPSSAAMR